MWDVTRSIQHAMGSKRFFGTYSIGGSSKILEWDTPSPDEFPKEKLEQIEKNVRDSVAYAVGTLIGTHPFFAEALIKLKYVYTYLVDAAATDGAHIFINPLFFNQLTREGIQWVVLHEVMHCVLLHFLRMEERNPFKWNVATDLEINLVLSEELKFNPKADSILKDVWYEEEVRGMSAEQIYNQYKELKLPPPPPPPIGPTGPGGITGPEGTGPERTGPEGTGPEGTGPVGPRPPRKPRDPKGPGGVISKQEGEDILRREKIAKNKEIDNANEVDWKKIFEQCVRNAGATGVGGLLRGIIKKRMTPKIDWKKELEEYVGDVISSEKLRIPSKKHVSKGEYRSRMRPYSESLEDVVCAIDTSGSMVPFVPPLFFEISGILDSEKISEMDVLYFDTEVDHSETLYSGDSPDPERITGGGGTLFMPVVDWIDVKKEYADLVIIMSDGDNHDTDLFYQQSPEWGDNCIWLIVDNPLWVPPFGRVIHVTREQLIKNG